MEIKEIQELVEQLYKENCKSIVLDGIDGKDYTCDDCFIHSKFGEMVFRFDRGRLVENTDFAIKTFMNNVVAEIDACRFATIANFIDVEEVNDISVGYINLQMKKSDDIVVFKKLGSKNRYEEIKTIDVPQTRFYSAIDIIEGGQGGFKKHENAQELKFLILDKSKLFTVAKFMVKEKGNLIEIRVLHDVLSSEDVGKFVYVGYKEEV